MTVELREPMGLKIYRAVSRASAPIARLALKRRLEAGKENPDRINERTGEPGSQRPDGDLIWIHGASVGESLSVVPLVERLQSRCPNAHFLVTTGTVTSARLMSERLPHCAIHQFIPLDHPDFVARFLDHWRPNTAIFVESEFWPNLIRGARDHASFMALVNGRISPKSFDGWRRQSNSIKYILSAFDEIIAQDRENATRLTELSGRTVKSVGNIKYAAAALPGTDEDVASLKAQIGDRPVWLAASTHPGEEEVILATANILKTEYPSLLTIITPRHPTRGTEVKALADEKGFSTQLRSSQQPITDDTNIYIADTLGELGLFYRLCDISFVGGSLAEKGGHNPLEPARLSSAILHGPHIFNFVDTYSHMRKSGGAALVRNERELATAIRRLFSDHKTRLSMTTAARNSAEDNAEQILNDVCTVLLPHLATSSTKK